MKKLFFPAFAAFAFASAIIAFSACSDDNDSEPANTTTITFENNVLGASGYLWGKPQATEQDDTDYLGNPVKSDIFYGPVYTEQDAQVYTYFSDCGHTFDSWNGFVISNHGDMTTEGYANDKSVYASRGAGGSRQYAVGYYGAWTPNDGGVPLIEFSEAVRPVSIAVANTTFFYFYFKGSNAAPIVDVKLVIKGYNNANQTGSVEYKLANGTAGTVRSGWAKVNISALGTVTSMKFSVETADDSCPLYFAVDDLVYIK